MRFVYPRSVLNPSIVDELFRDEAREVRLRGHRVSTIDFEAVSNGRVRPVPDIGPGESVLYRGWMMTAPEYESSGF